MKLTELTVDPDRAENGAWVDDIPEMEGLRLKVRGNMNTDWRRLQAKLLDAVPRKKRLGGRIDTDEMEKIISSCLLNACLLDWEGLEDENGQPIPYSKQFAQKLLTEPEFRRFRDGVSWASQIVAEKIEGDKDDTVGNLSLLSGGSTTGEPKRKAG
jgi:hypothetical protein